MDLGGGGGGNAIAGQELETIETEQLAFQSASGDEQLRLLPSPWPEDNLPPNTSALLSIASSKGLIAAAGPDALVISSTESVRRSFINDAADPDTKVKNFAPQATIQIPRVSQVAFSSDESCLVIAAEQGGGLAVYDTNALGSGNSKAAFELSTEGESVRQLLPNPNPSQGLSGLYGVITMEGKLLMADLKGRKLIPGPSGSTTFLDQASCGCWSRLGKQIIVGLADGTSAQIDPAGNVKDRIPQPPQLADLRPAAASALPVTSIYWIETNDFLIIHTPINPPDSGADDDSFYHLAHREKSGNSTTWTFSRLIDPCPHFGPERKPAHHFVQRLREWESLNEMMVLASTASTDIGLFTKSKKVLSEDPPVTDVFTQTNTPEGRRAAMPMGVVSEGSDTSPIGMAIDLSTTEKINKPIPNDETIDESPVPLPALYILNNEGMLNMWWIVYNESIRQSKPYPDLIAAGGPRSLDQKKTQDVASPASHAHPSSPMRPPSSTSAFGQASAIGSGGSAFGQSAFGKPSTPSQSTFGQSSFGQSNTPAFGGSSTLGGKASPWGAPASVATGGGPTFGKSTFGQTSTFGQPSGSSNQSTFGQPSGSSSQSTFGQASGGGSQSTFGKLSGSGNQSTFGSGFGQIGGMGANKGSVWGTPSQSQSTAQQSPQAGSVFGGNASNSSPFMNMGNSKSGSSGFAALGSGDKDKTTTSLFGEKKPSLPAEPSGSTISFGNNTSFGSGSTTFGVRSGFGSPDPASNSTFGKPSAPASREESMGDNESTTDTASTAKPSTEAGKGLFGGLGAGGFKLGSTFKGDGSAKDDLPKPKDPGAGLFGKGFGDALGATSKASSNSEQAAWLSGRSTPSSAPVKKEPDSEEDGPKLKDIPPAAPPKQEEKKSAPVDDAPLPPDPSTWNPKPGALPPPIPPGFGADFGKPAEKKSSAPQDAPLPPDFGVSKKSNASSDEPVAGSPPVDVGNEKFSEGVASDAEEEGPPEDDEEWSDEDEGSGGEEDEADEEEDESAEEQGTPEITDQKGLSAFEARLTPASPKRGESKTLGQEQSTTPATDKKESYTPAGLPPAPVMFPPPQRKGPQSPRSPSPQRSATSPLRQMPTFGSSQPPMPTQKAPTQSVRMPSSQQPFSQSQQPASRSTSEAQQIQRIAVPPAQLLPKQPDRPTPPSKPAEPDAGSLEDEEDARIQSILSAPVEPTRDVSAFLAHQDYIASSNEKTGLGGQIERVFRDINSMIDTLALNARALKGFVAGNMRPTEAELRGRFDLEDEEGWALGEASELSRIVDGIEIELNDGKLEDVRGALESLREEEKEVAKLRAKSADAKKRIQAKRDPEQLSLQAHAALPVETQTLQAELRQGAQKVQTLLSKAEELLSVLRVELASQPQKKGSDGTNVASVPTVEAVEKTIRKMTKMIEERSGDVDVLEAKIRKLSPEALKALKGLDANGEVDDLAASLKATKLDRSNSTALRASRASRVSTYGSPVAARRSRIGGTPIREGTPGTADSALKKSLMAPSNDEVEAYRLKKDARRRAMERLKETLENRGARIVKVGE